MNEMEVFEYYGNFYHIARDKHELRENYLERVWFILNKLNEGKEMTTLIRESRIYSAQRLYGCIY